jgi:hypothetical protein
MEKKVVRLTLIAATAILPLASLVWAYPHTVNCPIDGQAAHSTGHTKTTMQSGCLNVEYNHKGTDYSDPAHPKKFKHIFWVTQCEN